MTNYYNRGTFFERLIKHWLERNNYYVMRSAGSFSAFDLAVFPLENTNYNIENIEIELGITAPFVIQLKSLDLSNYEGTKLDNYLWSNDLTKFRTTKVFVPKLLFIFNSKKKYAAPLVYKFENSNYVQIQGRGLGQGTTQEVSGSEAGKPADET